jgi:hypothetical protein
MLLTHPAAHNLLFVRQTLTCKVMRPGKHPGFLGEGVRRAFGQGLRVVVGCKDSSPDTMSCPTCAKKHECSYVRLYKPYFIRKPDPCSGETQLPPPYVLSFSCGSPKALETRRHYSAGETITVSLTLFGRDACSQAALAALAMEAGLNRFFVTRDLSPGFVHARTIYGPCEALMSDWLRKTANQIAFMQLRQYSTTVASEESLRIRLTSPLLLDNKLRAPGERTGFSLLLERIARRMKNIALHYANELPPEPYSVDELARAVSCAESLRAGSYRSNKTSVAAWTGHLDVSGHLAPYYDWLAAGMLLHIGKSPSMGYGAYSIECASQVCV